MPINQLEGVQQDVPRTIAMMPAADRRRLRGHRHAARRRAPRCRSDDRADGAGPVAGHDAAARSRCATCPEQVAGADRRRSDDEPAARRVPGVAGGDRRRPIATRLTQRPSTPTPSSVSPAFKRLHEFLVDDVPARRAARRRRRRAAERRRDVRVQRPLAHDDATDAEGDPRDRPRGGDAHPRRDGRA